MYVWGMWETSNKLILKEKPCLYLLSFFLHC